MRSVWGSIGAMSMDVSQLWSLCHTLRNGANVRILLSVISIQLVFMPSMR